MTFTVFKKCLEMLALCLVLLQKEKILNQYIYCD